MQVRCGTCHGAVWVQIPAAKRRNIVRCHACSQEYDFGALLQRTDLEVLHQDAVVLAKDNKIDLQAAYSVLLGIFNLEQARDGCDPSLCPSLDVGAADPGPLTSHDPAFVDAIKAGHLTAEQATQRGNRRAFAESLVEQHRLPLEHAFAVADNRVPLLSAIRARKPKPRVKLDRERPRRAPAPLVIAAAVILVVAVVIALT